MNDAFASHGWPFIFLGIQHPKLALYALDTANRPFCFEKWAFVRNEWHSKDCLFIFNKEHCSGYTTYYSNIWHDRVPQLYSKNEVEESNAIPPSDSDIETAVSSEIEVYASGLISLDRELVFLDRDDISKHNNQ